MGLTFFLEVFPPSCSSSHLLLAAVGRLRPLGGAAEGGAVVAEVAGWVHLVLGGGGQQNI